MSVSPVPFAIAFSLRAMSRPGCAAALPTFVGSDLIPVQVPVDHRPGAYKTPAHLSTEALDGPGTWGATHR